MITTMGFLYSGGGEIDSQRTESPLNVISCGHFVLLRKHHTETNRPHGRRDFQLIYVHAGKGYYLLGGKKRTVEQGHIVIYRPYEPQHYLNYLGDRPDIYWLHFSGNAVEEELRRLGLWDKHVYYIKSKNEYIRILDRIIQELQLKRRNFSEIADSNFKELLCLMSRESSGQADDAASRYKLSPRTGEVDDAIQLFHMHYNQPINLTQFAGSRSMSLCWFSRIFRRQTGMSPRQFLIEVRINKAKELLALSSSVSDVSELLGYDDPLYFSRLFKRHTGYSPRDYHKRQLDPHLEG